MSSRADQPEEGAGGRREVVGAPDEHDPALDLRLAQLDRHEPGGAVEPGARQERDAGALGGERGHHAEVGRLERDPGAEAGLRAGRLQHDAQAARGGERDERLVAQRGEAHAPPPGERVVGRHGDHGRLARDQPAAEAGGRLLARAEAHVGRGELAARDGGEQRVRLLLGERDLDGRVRAPEGGDRAHDGPVGQRLDEPDREPAGEEALKRDDRLPPVRDRGQRRARVGQERRTRRGQRDRGPRRDRIVRRSCPAAQEERLAELGLEPPDLHAHRGLRDRKPLRRAREVLLLGHRDEIGELRELHNETLSAADADGIGVIRADDRS